MDLTPSSFWVGRTGRAKGEQNTLERRPGSIQMVSVWLKSRRRPKISLVPANLIILTIFFN